MSIKLVMYQSILQKMALDLCPQLRHGLINRLVFNSKSILHQCTHPQSRKIVHTSATVLVPFDKLALVPSLKSCGTGDM